MNQGKLTLREVGSRSIDVSFSQADEWVQAALLKAAPHEDLVGMSPSDWAKKSQLSGSLTAERIDPEYSVFGSFEARVPILCPRCGADGTAARSSDFRLFLKVLGPRETAEASDDPDYIILETAFIDLTEILAEQLVAAEAVVERPDLDLNGQNHECAELEDMAQLNELGLQENKTISQPQASGQTNEKGRNSPFAVLGSVFGDVKNLQSKGAKKDDEG